MALSKRKFWQKILAKLTLLVFVFNFIPAPSIATQLQTNADFTIDSPFGPLQEICSGNGIIYVTADGTEVPFAGGAQGALKHYSHCIISFSKVLILNSTLIPTRTVVHTRVKPVFIAYTLPTYKTLPLEHPSRGPPQEI